MSEHCSFHGHYDSTEPHCPGCEHEGGKKQMKNPVNCDHGKSLDEHCVFCAAEKDMSDRVYCIKGLATLERTSFDGEVVDHIIVHVDGSECSGEECGGNDEILKLREFMETYMSTQWEDGE